MTVGGKGLQGPTLLCEGMGQSEGLAGEVRVEKGKPQAQGAGGGITGPHRTPGATGGLAPSQARRTLFTKCKSRFGVLRLSMEESRAQPSLELPMGVRREAGEALVRGAVAMGLSFY